MRSRKFELPRTNLPVWTTKEASTKLPSSRIDKRQNSLCEMSLYLEVKGHISELTERYIYLSSSIYQRDSILRSTFRILHGPSGRCRTRFSWLTVSEQGQDCPLLTHTGNSTLSSSMATHPSSLPCPPVTSVISILSPCSILSLVTLSHHPPPLYCTFHFYSLTVMCCVPIITQNPPIRLYFIHTT